MSADLEQVESLLARVTSAWDDAAPSIALAELRVGSLDDVDPEDVDPEDVLSMIPVDVEIVDAGAPRGMRRWRSPLAMAAALIVVLAVAGALVALTRSPDSIEPSSPVTVPGSDTSSPPSVPSTMPPSTAPAAVSTTDAPAPESIAPALDEAEVATAGGDAPAAGVGAPATEAQLAAIQREQAAVLATFDSVSFTATISGEYEDHPEMSGEASYDVVLLADGSMWATGADGWMNSYEPSTGTARTQWPGVDGVLQHQVLTGQTGNSVPLLTMLLADPTAPVSASTGVVIEPVTFDGGDAWKVSQHQTTMAFDPDNPAAEGPWQFASWTVDRRTGLVVAATENWVYDEGGDRAQRTMVLSNIVLGAELPPEFPGTFPDDVPVTISGGPNPYPLLSVEEASAIFGAGFAVPEPVPTFISTRTDGFPGSMPGKSSDQSVGPGPAASSADQPVTNRLMQLEWKTGFVSLFLTMSKMLLDPNVDPATIPEGWVAVDGVLCESDDGTTCRETGDPAIITSGAWAGEHAVWNGASLTATRNGVTMTISAPTPEQALAIANSLVAVP